MNFGGTQFSHNSCVVATTAAEASATSILQGPGNLGVLWHRQEGEGTENSPPKDFLPILGTGQAGFNSICLLL